MLDASIATSDAILLIDTAPSKPRALKTSTSTAVDDSAGDDT
ncbi:unnamed protein product, partial [Tilletia controversa]